MGSGRKYIWERSAERLTMPLLGAWSRPAGPWRDCLVEGLSASGCFVVADEEDFGEELIDVKFRSPSGRWLTFRGEVVYYVRGRGLALSFCGLRTDEKQLLGLVVECLRIHERAVSLPT